MTHGLVSVRGPGAGDRCHKGPQEFWFSGLKRWLHTVVESWILYEWMLVPSRLFLSLSCGIQQDKWCIQWPLGRSVFQLGCTTINIPLKLSHCYLTVVANKLETTMETSALVCLTWECQDSSIQFHDWSTVDDRTTNTHTHNHKKKERRNAGSGSNTEASVEASVSRYFPQKQTVRIQTRGNLTSRLALAKSSSGSGSLPKGSDTRLMLQLTGLKKHLTDP